MLIARGYEMTADEKRADVVLLNTCSVRDLAEQKALGKMGLLGRLRADKPEWSSVFSAAWRSLAARNSCRELGTSISLWHAEVSQGRGLRG
jgi:tRNA-2-methylthio-N6-dimethylallyladenosine synthase